MHITFSLESNQYNLTVVPHWNRIPHLHFSHMEPFRVCAQLHVKRVYSPTLYNSTWLWACRLCGLCKEETIRQSTALTWSLQTKWCFDQAKGEVDNACRAQGQSRATGCLFCGHRLRNYLDVSPWDRKPAQFRCAVWLKCTKWKSREVQL